MCTYIYIHAGLAMKAAHSQRPSVAGHPGKSKYPGIWAIKPILAAVLDLSGRHSLSGQSQYPGNKRVSEQTGSLAYPGKRAIPPTRAPWQHNLSGHPGNIIYPGLWPLSGQ